MFGFMKSLSSKLSYEIQMVILAVLSMIALFVYVDGITGFFNVLNALLPITLILIAVWLLFIKKNYMVSYIILFLFVFGQGLRTFIQWMLSYHFFFEDFMMTFSLNMLLVLAACLYLLLMMISIYFVEGFKIQIKAWDLPMLGLLFGLYVYFNQGLLMLLFTVLYVILSESTGIRLATLALMLSQVVTIPFIVIQRFIDDAAKNTRIFDWVMNVFGLVVIYFIVIALIKLLEPHEKQVKVVEEK